jgi:hypothetical protein
MRRLAHTILVVSAAALVASVGSCSLHGGADRSLLTGQPCGPPCWQGLVPGVSTLEEVLAYMKRSYYVGDYYRDGSIIRWQSTQGGRSYGAWNAFAVEGDLLMVIRTYLDYDLTLDQLLERYGPPEKFQANWKGGSSVDADITLFYPALGLAPRVELKPSNGGYDLQPDTLVILVWYFPPTSLEGLVDLAGYIPFPQKEEYAETVLQDWHGYGLIELIP